MCAKVEQYLLSRRPCAVRIQQKLSRSHGQIEVMSLCGNRQILLDGSLGDLIFERRDKSGRLEGNDDGWPSATSVVDEGDGVPLHR